MSKSRSKKNLLHSVVDGFFPGRRFSDDYCLVFKHHICRPATLLITLWLSHLQPQCDTGRWLDKKKEAAVRLCRLHVIPQIMELFNNYGPLIEGTGNTPNIRQFLTEAGERFGSNTAILVCLVCCSSARSMLRRHSDKAEDSKRNIAFDSGEKTIDDLFDKKGTLKEGQFASLKPMFNFEGNKMSLLGIARKFHQDSASLGHLDSLLSDFPFEKVAALFHGGNATGEKLAQSWVLTDKAFHDETERELGKLRLEVTSQHDHPPGEVDSTQDNPSDRERDTGEDPSSDQESQQQPENPEKTQAGTDTPPAEELGIRDLLQRYQEKEKEGVGGAQGGLHEGADAIEAKPAFFVKRVDRYMTIHTKAMEHHRQQIENLLVLKKELQLAADEANKENFNYPKSNKEKLALSDKPKKKKRRTTPRPPLCMKQIHAMFSSEAKEGVIG